MSHSANSLVTQFEETLTGTCVGGATLNAAPGEGVTIVSTRCDDGELTVLIGLAATQRGVVRRSFSLDDGMTNLEVAFDFHRDCPEGYVGVPADMDYATGDFCLAKYEMKATDGSGKLVNAGNGDITYADAHVPASRYDGTPWQNISRQQAINECASLGPGYRLIDNDQWQVVARNVERTPANWHATPALGGTDGIVGHGMLPRGHSDDTPEPTLAAAAVDSDGYAGTDNSATQPWDTSLNSSGAEQKRTLVLSNGSVVWDFAGNNWEWVSTNIVGDALTPALTGAWHDYTDSAFAQGSENRRLFAPKGPYNRQNGAGALYGGTNGAIARGSVGSGNANTSGVFSVGLNGAKGRAKAFRCVFVTP